MRPADLKSWWLRSLILLVLAALPVFLPTFWTFIATSIIVLAVIASSVGILTGTAGMVSLCQMSFAAVGGWVVTYLNANGVPIPFFLQVIIGALVTVPIGVLIGLPALRLRGVNLAVVTLGFAAVVDLVLVNNNFPGANVGKPVLRPDVLSSDLAYYWFCLGAFALVTLGLGAIMRQRLGSSWLAVKHSERATAALGLSVSGTKLTAFAVSAFVAGLGGGLLAGQLGLLTSRNFDPVTSLVLFATAVMAGARYAGGAVLAGALTVLLPELLRRLNLPQDIGSAVFMVGTIQALSKGAGIVEGIVQSNLARRSTTHTTPSSYQFGSSQVESSQVEPVANVSSTLALELEKLSVKYGQVTALEDVNLRVLEGQVMGLIGPNGAGKSSLVDAVTGFTLHTGQVRLEGQTMNGLNVTSRARLGLRRNFQQDRTIPELSAAAYLNLSAGRVLEPSELERALGFAGISDALLELHSLDVGTRRLLEVAGVLASNPKLVLLDEPAAGLSSSESVMLGRGIAQIPARYGCAVLLIEHDMELVREACSDVTVLDFGRVIATGKTVDVLGQSNVIAAYLGANLEESVNA